MLSSIWFQLPSDIGVMPVPIADMSQSVPIRKPFANESPFIDVPVLYIPVWNISSGVEKKLASLAVVV
jgi:hypothetical protein